MTEFWKILKCWILWKSVQWELGIQTDDGQTDMTQLIVAFCNFVNVTKKLLKSWFLRILRQLKQYTHEVCNESENMFWNGIICGSKGINKIQYVTTWIHEAVPTEKFWMVHYIKTLTLQHPTCQIMLSPCHRILNNLYHHMTLCSVSLCYKQRLCVCVCVCADNGTNCFYWDMDK